MIESEVTVGAGEFAAAVGWVAKWAPSKPLVPIHAGVRITVASGSLALEVEGEPVSARTVVEVKESASRPTSRPAVAVVSARLLAAIAEILGKRADVVIGPEVDGALQVRQGRTVLTLPTMVAEDFPALAVAPAPIAEVDGAALATAVKQAGFVAKGSDKLPALACLYLGFTESAIEVMAASMPRSAITSVPWTFRAGAPALRGPLYQSGAVSSATPWAPTMMQAAAAFNAPAPVEIGCDGNLLSMSDATRSLTMQLQRHDWPVDLVRRFITLEHPHAVTFARVDAGRPLKFAGIYLEEQGYSRMTLGPDEIEIQGGGTKKALGKTVASGGAAADVIPAAGYDGDPVTIGFNPQYLTEALAEAPGDTIRLAFAGPTNPMLLTCDADPAWLHVLMPIRIR